MRLATSTKLVGNWQHALTPYTLLDLPDAERVRNKIDGLQATPPMST
jgi:hypothetical protein